MFAKYLDENITDALTSAIADATINNAQDPVDYIGRYLLKILDDQKQNKIKNEKKKKLYDEHQKILNEINIQNNKKQEILNQKNEKIENENKFFDELKLLCYLLYSCSILIV